MAVKRYDGSQWVTVAGKGDQGTSSSISTWVKTATGGETSVSGNDDNSQPLSYTVGQELVFINGALQKRGADYTATTGNSITGLTALAANDVVTVWTVNAFSVTNAISNTLVDAKGDLVTATSADVPARLAVGSNGQVLVADSTTGTGLKWAADSTGYTLLASGTHSGTNLSLTSISGSYVDLYLVLDNIDVSADTFLRLRFNNDTTANRHRAFTAVGDGGTFLFTSGDISATFDATGSVSTCYISVPNYANTTSWKFANSRSLGTNPTDNTQWSWSEFKVAYNQTSAVTQLDIFENANGTFSCGYKLYGVK